MSASQVLQLLRNSTKADAEDPIAASDAPRIHLQLLSQGRTIGRATRGDWHKALAAAREDALSALPLAGDSLQRQAQAQVVENALVSLELAQPATSLELTTFAAVDWDVRSGLEGLIVTPPNGSAIAIFPSEMTSRAGSSGGGQTPAQALLSAISEAVNDPAAAMPGVPGKEVGDLIKAGWKFERFRVEHAVELSKGGAPVTLTRGGALVPGSAITLASMQDWREKLRAHLRSRVREIREGERHWLVVDATYAPVLDRVLDEASRSQALLLAYALASSDSHVAAGLVRDLIENEPIGGPIGEQRVDHVANASLLLASLALEAEDREMLLKQWPTLFFNCFQVASQAHRPDGTWTKEVPESARALIALAMVRYASTLGDNWRSTSEGMLARRTVEQLLASGQPGALVTHMPWLGLSAAELGDSTEVAGAAVLREMRSLLWQRQIAGEVAIAEGRDLEGALLFGTGVDARRSLGWQTARPISFLACMLGDARFTPPQERMNEVVRLATSLRFLRQLTMDEACLWNTPRPEKAMWGVRNAPWDNRQSLEASVMTLLTLDAAIGSLESMK